MMCDPTLAALSLGGPCPCPKHSPNHPLAIPPDPSPGPIVGAVVGIAGLALTILVVYVLGSVAGMSIRVNIPEGSVSDPTWACLVGQGYQGRPDGRLADVPLIAVRLCSE